MSSLIFLDMKIKMANPAPIPSNLSAARHFLVFVVGRDTLDQQDFPSVTPERAAQECCVPAAHTSQSELSVSRNSKPGNHIAGPIIRTGNHFRNGLAAS